MKYLNVLWLISMLWMTACSSQEHQVNYFKQHPEAAQKVAHDCVQRAMQQVNIEKDSLCMAVVAYEREICLAKHQEGAIFYLDYDCHNNVQMMGLALRGY